MDGYSYFVVRLARLDADPNRLSGLIERLGSGEKRTFDDQDQLLRLFTSWPFHHANMPPGQTDRNSPG
jgi:hypothetical protein